MFTFSGADGVTSSGMATQHAAKICNSCAAGIAGGASASHVAAVTVGQGQGSEKGR